MAYWKNYEGTSYVSREGSTIYIDRLNLRRTVSDFIRVLVDAICYRKYSDLTIDFAKVGTAFPNAIVPFAGILEYYTNQGITFNYQNIDSHLRASHILAPSPYIGDFRHIMNTVWRFSSSEEVAAIVAAFIEEMQKSAQFYKGVLNAVEWSLNEVMDNVIQHSKVGFGYVMGQLHSNSKQITFTVYDSGQGILNSLRGSSHSPRSASDAITMAIKEEVTRDKNIGQGNGLFGLHSIVKQGKGQLAITSGDGSYIYAKGDAKTYDYLPVISRETPGTIVDFQLSYDKDMSLDKALVFRGKVYEIVNIKYEDLEDDFGRIHYKISEHAEGTGTRQAAVRAKNEIFNILAEQHKPITIDFSDIAVISSSFADELLAKLFIELGLFQFNNLIKIKGLDSSQQNILQRSVIQRLREIATPFEEHLERE